MTGGRGGRAGSPGPDPAGLHPAQPLGKPVRAPLALGGPTRSCRVAPLGTRPGHVLKGGADIHSQSGCKGNAS